MPRPFNRLMFLALGLLVMAFYWGCEQPDDVFTPVATTALNLVVERLPEPPDSMVYELWVSKNANQDTAAEAGDVVSLGRFSYMISDTAADAFLDPDGTPREDSNQFVLHGDLFSYRSIFVSVETVDDADLAKPGPIMLTANIVPIKDFTPVLNFPHARDLRAATVRYNLEAVSDDDRDSNDGRGIWFSSYRIALDTIPDTFWLNWSYTVDTASNVIDTIIDTTIDTIDTLTIDTTIDTVLDTNMDSLYASRDDSIHSIVVDTIQILYGPDSLLLGLDSFFAHIRVRFTMDRVVDTIEPYIRKQFQLDYYYDTVGAGTTLVRYDIFSQDQFGLPDLSAYGWKYEGWAVSPYIEYSDPEETPRFAGPAWPYKSPFGDMNWFPGDTGGLISTGTFTRIDTADDENPYTLIDSAGILEIVDTGGGIDSVTIFKRPYYPGEDFLNSDSLMARSGGQLGSVDLMPEADDGNIKGTVFISVEPNNRKTTESNFPLILFLGAVPSSRSYLDNPRVVDMHNLCSDVPGNPQGLPEIWVTFTRR